LTGSQATARPVTDEQLLACGVSPWMGPKSLPLWVPGEQLRSIALLDGGAAYEAGLQVRPLRETLAAALRYEEERQGERPAGLRDEEERELRQSLAAGQIGRAACRERGQIAEGTRRLCSKRDSKA